ncbi:MAG TPA: NusA-like transcription termination signal-binding factor [Candidatus Thermoplasmatota archaeon]|nr:NusA-like transcription termination signal-binding factor [Candidatus Thermoplasmatota archaeon]
MNPIVEIKLDGDSLRNIAAFENFTRARVRDCFEDGDRLVFVVEEGDLGKALGKGAANVLKLRELLRKDLEVYGFAADREAFVRNIFHRFELTKVGFEKRKDGSEIVRVAVDPRDKGKAIGRGGRNIQLAKTLLQRHAGLSDVFLE